MKYVFLAAFAVLLAWSGVMRLSAPGRAPVLGAGGSVAPVLFWVTDSNPARTEQVALFRQELARQGLSDIDLRLDMANSDGSKKVIQGVSGVLGDLVDVAPGDVLYYKQLGIIADVTDEATASGFDPTRTYPPLADEITVPDSAGRRRQYVFPANASVAQYFVNLETLERAGQPPVPTHWTIQEFEARGKAFVEAANAKLPRRTVFFADAVPPEPLRATLGGHRFDETLSGPGVDSEATRRAWALIYKWTYKDRILPSAADQAGMSTDAGYMGRAPQLLISERPERGQVAMMLSGRHMMITFRLADDRRKAEGRAPMRLSLSEMPHDAAHGGTRVVEMSARSLSLYAGSGHRAEAAKFMAFLASEPYNLQVARDSDALPPNPEYLDHEAFLRPPGRENEWPVHAAFARVAREISIGRGYSPFVLQAVANRAEIEAFDLYMNDRMSLDAAVTRAAKRIEDEMQRAVREAPSLRADFEARRADQRRIDTLRAALERDAAAGRPPAPENLIPAGLVRNPYFRHLYRERGWLK